MDLPFDANMAISGRKSRPSHHGGVGIALKTMFFHTSEFVDHVLLDHCWIIYPLVNLQKTMENHHAINGKTHYFYGNCQQLF